MAQGGGIGKGLKRSATRVLPHVSAWLARDSPNPDMPLSALPAQPVPPLNGGS